MEKDKIENSETNGFAEEDDRGLRLKKKQKEEKDYIYIYMKLLLL